MHKPEFVEIVLFRKTEYVKAVTDCYCPVFEFGVQTVKFLGNQLPAIDLGFTDSVLQLAANGYHHADGEFLP